MAASRRLLVFFTALAVSLTVAASFSATDSDGSSTDANNAIGRLGIPIPRRNSTGPMVTDLSVCGPAELPPHALPPFQCCPPPSPVPPIDFKFPDSSEPLRVRRRMHKVSAEFLANFTRAIELMKALPKDDPRSFYQQANIHCAYCTGAYKQLGHPELNIQVHNTWFFQPLHRGYLYFFERILGKLIGDPAFAVPFWNWDAPEGMPMPSMFSNRDSTLFDPLRNPSHSPPRYLDMHFDGVDVNRTAEEQVELNLRTMYRQLITNAPLPSLFHGQPYRPGDKPNPGAGSLEVYPHNHVHYWCGDLRRPNNENMGVYYSAGRDPILYPHHSNIDRMWEVWRALDPNRHVDFSDPDWLDASFLFYDEDARLVRMRVRDVLDSSKLRYTYENVHLQWVNAKPTVTPGLSRQRRAAAKALEAVRFPVSLQRAVTAEVRRPRVARSRLAKAVEEEVLVVEGIEFDGTELVKFDVYINAPEYHKVGRGGRELAGSYMSLKHVGHRHHGTFETSLRLALNELLEDLDADGDETVAVTLVPKQGKVRIGGLRIEYLLE
ncbi:polyphenol oxidase, chloroplastic-like [Phragmites australis]|uniref:polyphenol oxidase, chloroplastic-like n=1 Tax=Phragmites australis TaxID=29695 RepID=UPI002D782E8C|nr:polyphenol oxidase, chloroplastic-like [Phragmites australis]